MRKTPIVSNLFTGNDVGRKVTLKGKDVPDSQVIRISTPDMIKMLNKLKGYSSTTINNLPKDVRDELTGFSELISFISESPAYSETLKTINDIFGDVAVVRPDTVGAFFRGCFVSNEYPGLQSCSAICAGNLAPDHNTGGWTFCQENVILFDGEKLSFQHKTDQRKDKAIIHVINENKFTGFTDANIQALLENGIKTVSLHIFQDSGKTVEKLNSQPVTSLPRKGAPARSQSHPPPPPPDNNKNEDNGWLWIVLVFLGIIIIGGLIWWASRRQGGWSQGWGQSAQQGGGQQGTTWTPMVQPTSN